MATELDFTTHNLLKTLVQQKGSDLHISANSPPRIRVNGRLLSLNTKKLTGEHSRKLCYSVLNEFQQKELEKNKELDLAFTLKGIGRFRANVFHYKGLVGAAIRAIPESAPDFKELGLPKAIHKFSKLHNGLILICGATGSGKSTTLASLINEVNKNKQGTIFTIEDPIEYIHHHKNCLVIQRELHKDTHSFNNALRAVLRQDPDVILVGEMRDLETIQLTLTAAETGHLVFATLHTNNAVSTINRIIDSFPSGQQSQVRSQLALVLSGVVNQTLIPSLKGGRVLGLEILIPNVAIRNLIREDKLHMVYSSMQTDQENTGMMTYNQSLLTLLKTGHINRIQAMQLTSSTDELETMIKRSGIAA
ncbi:MAG: type IV pilus twitching motility protein PilT [Proteobacteria bacterium]|nr:type IV pilus twitching motility protein PilT [Pseudomonadota bacterium]